MLDIGPHEQTTSPPPRLPRYWEAERVRESEAGFPIELHRSAHVDRQELARSRRGNPIEFEGSLYTGARLKDDGGGGAHRKDCVNMAPRVGMVAKLSSEGKVCIEGPCTTALRSRGAERGASCAAGVGTAGAAFPTGRERDHREQLHLRRGACGQAVSGQRARHLRRCTHAVASRYPTCGPP